MGTAHEKFDETGKLIDQETIDQLVQVIAAVVAHHGSLVAS